MPTRDEVHIIRTHLQELIDRAPEAPARTGGADESENASEWMLWVNQAADAVQMAAPSGSYLHKQAEAVRTKKIRSSADGDRQRQRMLDLLEAADNTARLSVKDAISDDLRRAVEIAVTDGYFRHWTFKYVCFAFAVLFMALFGGTVAGWLQFSGVQKTAEEGRINIQQKVDAFQKQIDDRTSHLDDLIRNAVKTQDPRVAQIIDKAVADSQLQVQDTKRKLDQAQTDTVNGMRDQLRDQLQTAVAQQRKELEQQATQLSGDWKGLTDKLSGQFTAISGDLGKAKQDALAKINAPAPEIEEARKSAVSSIGGEATKAVGAVDSARDMAVRTINSRGTDVEDERKKALSSIETARTVANNKLAQYEAEAEGKRNDATRAIAKANDDVVQAAGDARKQIAEQVAGLPNDVKKVSTILESLNRALADYHVDISGLMEQFVNDDGTRVGLVTQVLGWTYWVVVIAAGVSVLSLIIAVFAWISARRQRRLLWKLLEQRATQ